MIRPNPENIHLVVCKIRGQIRVVYHVVLVLGELLRNSLASITAEAFGSYPFISSSRSSSGVRDVEC